MGNFFTVLLTKMVQKTIKGNFQTKKDSKVTKKQIFIAILIIILKFIYAKLLSFNI